MGSRRNRRNGNGRVATALKEDLSAMAETIEGTRKIQRRARIQSGINPRGSSRLCHWIAVAVWEGEDGSRETEVIDDGHSSEVEMRGYLHDAIWETAHLG
jgi:hypothetical protein